MNNYYYIISSLPALSLGKDENQFDYSKFRAEIYNLCADKDKKEIDFFEKGVDGENLSRDYYKEALRSSCDFIKKYYSLDLIIRNKKVSALAATIFGQEKAQEIIDKYSVSVEDSVKEGYKLYEGNSPLPFEIDSDDLQRLEAIFNHPNILEKEKMLDDFRWEKYNLFTNFEYFTFNNIVSFLAKGKMIERWNKLSFEKGKEMFNKLIEEVRGTYNKQKLRSKIDENNG